MNNYTRLLGQITKLRDDKASANIDGVSICTTLLDYANNLTTISDKLQHKPTNWEEFLSMAVDIAVKKNTDYESRFMKALLDPQLNGRSLWAWEVTKKLDRLRTWIKRGELKVKGEGALDSVIDLANYTVQFELSQTKDPFKGLEKRSFENYYDYLGPYYILRLLIDTNYTGTQLLNIADETDIQVAYLILDYMGVPVDDDRDQIAMKDATNWNRYKPEN